MSERIETSRVPTSPEPKFGRKRVGFVEKIARVATPVVFMFTGTVDAFAQDPSPTPGPDEGERVAVVSTPSATPEQGTRLGMVVTPGGEVSEWDDQARPENLAYPELWGRVLNEVTLDLPNGTPVTFTIRGDLQRMQEHGFIPFQFTNRSQKDLQELADFILLDTPNELNVLSVQYGVRGGSPQEDEIRPGERPLTVDLSNGVDIVLVPDETQDVPGLLGNMVFDGESGLKWSFAYHIDPNRTDKLTIYLYFNDFHYKGAPEYSVINQVVVPLTIARFFQEQQLVGRSILETSSTIHNSRRAPWGFISENIDEIIPIYDRIKSTLVLNQTSSLGN